MSKRLFQLTILCVVLFSAITLFLPNVLQEQQKPGTTKYGFPYPFLMDYFQYIAMIRSGQEGSLLYYNQHSEESFPPMFVFPQYHILGMMTKPFGIDQFDSFFIARTVSIALLLTVVVVASLYFLPTYTSRSLFLILFISSTSFWYVTNNVEIRDPEVYSDWFNVFKKLAFTPPHHVLAICVIICIILWIHNKKFSVKVLTVTSLSSYLLMELHPYLSIFLLEIFFVQILWTRLVQRSLVKNYLLHAVAYMFGMLPIFVYQYYLQSVVWGGEQNEAESLFVWNPPLLTPDIYIRALGPMSIGFALGVIIPSIRNTPKWRILLIWSALPLVQFFLPNIGVATGGLRLMQLYQHIPLSLLTALVVYHMFEKNKRKLQLITIVIGLASIMYAIPPYVSQFHERTFVNAFYYTHYYYLESLLPFQDILNTKIPKNSVILTLEIPGMVIPAISPHRVILGHVGNNKRYKEKTDQVEVFYKDLLKEKQLIEFLKKYNVDYILFTLGTRPYSEYSFSKLPFLSEYATTSQTTLVKVTL